MLDRCSAAPLVLTVGGPSVSGSSTPDAARDPAATRRRLDGWLTLWPSSTFADGYARLAALWPSLSPADCSDPAFRNVSAAIFSAPPPEVAAHSYDCVAALALALDATDDLDNTTGVLEALRTLRFDGATGAVAFEASTLDRDPASVSYVIANAIGTSDGFTMPNVATVEGGIVVEREPIRFIGGVSTPPLDLTLQEITCDAGHVPVRSTAGSGSVRACAQCPRGEFAPLPGMSNCTLCAPGKFARDMGATACEDCPPGHWCSSERPFECGVDRYGSKANVYNPADCSPCPRFSSTRGVANATSPAQCVCDVGFVEDKRASMGGIPACGCAEGEQLIDDGTRCEKCPIGSYKTGTGNTRCRACIIPRSTTAKVGATALSQCVCEAGTLLLWPRDEGFTAVNLSTLLVSTLDAVNATSEDGLALGNSTAAAQDSAALAAAAAVVTAAGFECAPCVDGADCREPGATLNSLPLPPGRWRQSNVSTYVRECPIAEACVGGTGVGEELCAEGYVGPLCATCSSDYYGGYGTPCEVCDFSPGEIGVTIAITSSSLFAVVVLGIGCATYLRKKAVRTIAESMQMVLSTSDNAEDIVAHAQAEASDVIQRRLVSKYACIAALVGFIGALGVKIRILVSLVQVLTMMPNIFSIQLPGVLEDFLNTLALPFEIIVLDIMPLQCVWPWTSGYAFKLTFDTVWPATVTLVLIVISRSLHWRYGNRKTPPSSEEGDTGQAALPRKRHVCAVFADVCSDLWFFVIFLTYPSVSSTVFTAFNWLRFDGPGEDGTRVLRDFPNTEVNSESGFVGIYAFTMVLVYPLGVPAMYLVTFFRAVSVSRREPREHAARRLHALPSPRTQRVPSCSLARSVVEQRHALDEIRRIEIVVETELKLAQHKSQGERRGTIMEARHDAAKVQYARHRDEYEGLRAALPSTLRKLTAGYEFRTYWFECFECMRKIAIVGMPIFFEYGSNAQLIVGLLISFVTYGAYAHFGPYIVASDDYLAQGCQIILFCSLLNAIMDQTESNDPVVSILMYVMALLPPAIGIFTDSPLLELCNSALGCSKANEDRDTLQRRVVAFFDWLLCTQNRLEAMESIDLRRRQHQASAAAKASLPEVVSRKKRTSLNHVVRMVNKRGHARRRREKADPAARILGSCARMMIPRSLQSCKSLGLGSKKEVWGEEGTLNTRGSSLHRQRSVVQVEIARSCTKEDLLAAGELVVEGGGGGDAQAAGAAAARPVMLGEAYGRRGGDPGAASGGGQQVVRSLGCSGAAAAGTIFHAASNVTSLVVDRCETMSPQAWGWQHRAAAARCGLRRSVSLPGKAAAPPAPASPMELELPRVVRVPRARFSVEGKQPERQPSGTFDPELVASSDMTASGQDRLTSYNSNDDVDWESSIERGARCFTRAPRRSTSAKGLGRMLGRGMSWARRTRTRESVDK